MPEPIPPTRPLMKAELNRHGRGGAADRHIVSAVVLDANFVVVIALPPVRRGQLDSERQENRAVLFGSRSIVPRHRVGFNLGPQSRPVGMSGSCSTSGLSGTTTLNRARHRASKIMIHVIGPAGFPLECAGGVESQDRSQGVFPGD